MLRNEGDFEKRMKSPLEKGMERAHLKIISTKKKFIVIGLWFRGRD
jgi:hypothetical protein